MSSYKRLPFPTAMAFEPIQLCNAVCFCCPYTWLKKQEGYNRTKMSIEQIRDLMDQFGRAREVYGYRGELKINPFRFSDPLVCEDLDVILECAAKHQIKVLITTNGLGFSSRNLALLDKHNDLIQKISVSLIGSTAEDIKELMGVDFNKIIRNLEEVSSNWPNIKRLTRVSLRMIRNTDDEIKVLQDLKAYFEKRGISVKGFRDNWLTNRVDYKRFDLKLVRPENIEKLTPTKQSADRFVVGCGWEGNLLGRLEVMVDGSVVLCCDDAESHKVFGNVFIDGIDSIWNGSLKEEHFLIMENQFTSKKNDLICATCSRARWNNV